MEMTRDSAELHLPPLPTEITKLVTIYPLDAPDFQKLMAQTHDAYQRIQKLFNDAKSKCEVPLNDNRFSYDIPKNASPSYRFLYGKMIKNLNKFRAIRREVQARYCNQLAIFSLFFQTLIENNVPGTCDFNGFNQFKHHFVDEDPEFAKHANKARRYKAYLTAKRIEYENSPEYTNKSLSKDIIEQAKHYSHIYSYCPSNPFDTKIEEFFIQNEKLKELDQIILDISGRGEKLPQKTSFRKKSKWNQPKMNANSFNNYINEFLLSLQTKSLVFDDIQKATFRSSVLRIIFNSLYTETNGLNMPDANFQKSAYIIMRLNPNDMNMPKIFSEEEKEKSFLELFKSIPKLQLISGKLSFIQFYTDPLDIAYDIGTVSLLIDEFAQERFPSQEIIKLAFDDFFIILVVCICSITISNPEGIRFYTEFYRDLESAQIMNHSMTSLAAAIKYVRDFDQQEHTPEVLQKINLILENYK
ncbi:hypothetical protein TVAG_397360 [Trichomonas vaginalis G3]|uniref:VPS9 domain-containing protein n=1 Tax=Trichomonas vaginalis (strain ATCC PRA-98 / G3) TaxID=412133 RepID=A2DXC3_TRIV3|nr:VPS9 domain family [Trichomonas vaginalis G3]EAY15005.1 hypothetical protein TVAG_397360 [Trichomonas vaginalis G3]KAI5507315.1 VPS9 domain family [Trichomonas vaginalis G3]|eukprot:XP_001327228.1 hypothetical protein [Trichomonas vaginalis G3]